MSQVGAFLFNPDSSSELDLYSTNKGLLIPRVTLSPSLISPLPVSSPASGLLVFNNGVNQEPGFYFWTGTGWTMLNYYDGDDVFGPATSTDNAIVRFHGTTGKIIQNSGVLMDDASNISQVSNLNVAGFQMINNPVAGKLLVSDNSGNASWESAPPIDVEEDDILITANASTLNFEGNLNVYEIDDYKATVRIYKNNVTNDVIQLYSSDSTDLNNLTSYERINWNVEQHKDASTFIHSTTSNTSRVTVRTAGIYEVNYMFSIVNKTIMRKTLRARFMKNGVDIIPYVTSYSFSYNMADDKVSHVSSSFLVELNAMDYVELIVNGQTNPGPVQLIPVENVFFMRLMREL